MFLRRIGRTLMRRIISALEETQSPMTAVVSQRSTPRFSPQDGYKSTARSSPKATIVA
jgi:hypothetical protein